MGLQKKELFIDDSKDVTLDEALEDRDQAVDEDDTLLDPLEALFLLHLIVYGPETEFQVELFM
jgi:hypothetical protein